MSQSNWGPLGGQSPQTGGQAANEQQAPAEQQTQSLRQRFSDWPTKGDERPQPWDLDALEVPKADRDLAAGAPDTVSPVVIRHSYPILTFGAAGATVQDLIGRLRTLGYDTQANPFGVLTNDVMSAVDRFREDYNVQEDPSPFGGNTAPGRQAAARAVGPYTWEAIVRASDRAEQEQAS